MKQKLLHLIWRLAYLTKFSPKSKQEAFYHLSLLTEKLPRYTHGKFQFPFGEIRYVDIKSLKYQYLEIFIEERYDFQMTTPQPSPLDGREQATPPKEAKVKSPIIFDCGGNIGLSVTWFKQRYPQSCITVFEADPNIGNVLAQNIANMKLDNVTLIRKAVWIKNGMIGFSSDGADSGRIDLWGPHPSRGAGRGGVEAIRLADYINQPIDLLKLDIEGAEFAVIQDLCETGKISHVKCFICEVHGRGHDKSLLADMLKLLEKHGFSFTFAHARSAPFLIGEPDPSPFPNASDGKFLLHLYAWQRG